MSNAIKTTNVCRPCGSGSTWGPADCRNYLGNEWTYIGEAPCNYDCIVAGASPGTSAKCQMTSYRGERRQCCLNGSSVTGTCDPTYNIFSPECDEVYMEHCRSRNNIVGDERCVKWATVKPTRAFPLLRDFCTRNPNAKECIEWCKNMASTGNSVCDTIYNTWCARPENKTAPICACINSPLQSSDININPKCNDKNCIMNGYLTQNMINTNCPDITNCNIQTTIVNSGIQLTNLNIDQKCGGKETQNTTYVDEPPAAPPQIYNYWLILIMIIVMAVVVCIIYLVQKNIRSRI